MSLDKTEKSLLRAGTETLLSYATANFIVAPFAAPLETKMLSVINHEKPISSQVLAQRTRNMFASYARWQVLSSIAGGSACLVWDRSAKPSNNQYVNASLGAVFAGTCETGATVYDEVKNKLQGLDLKNKNVLSMVGKIGLMIYLRNIIFWGGVVGADIYAKQNHLKPLEAGAISFVAGGSCAVLTMPLLNLMVRMLSSSGQEFCKPKPYSAANLFLGLPQRLAILTIYTLANNPLNDHVNGKYSDKIDEKLEKHKDKIEVLEAKMPKIAASFTENNETEIAANLGVIKGFEPRSSKGLEQTSVQISGFAEKLAKNYEKEMALV